MNIQRYAPKIATYIFVEASRNTEGGTWCIDFDEINTYYGVNLQEDNELLEEIEMHLHADFGNFIADFEVYDNQFDVNLWTNYCINDVYGEDELWEDD